MVLGDQDPYLSTCVQMDNLYRWAPNLGCPREPTTEGTYLPTYLPIYVHQTLHTYLPTYLPIYIKAYISTYLPTYLPI